MMINANYMNVPPGYVCVQLRETRVHKLRVCVSSVAAAVGRLLRAASAAAAWPTVESGVGLVVE